MVICFVWYAYLAICGVIRIVRLSQCVFKVHSEELGHRVSNTLFWLWNQKSFNFPIIFRAKNLSNCYHKNCHKYLISGQKWTNLYSFFIYSSSPIDWARSQALKMKSWKRCERPNQSISEKHNFWVRVAMVTEQWSIIFWPKITHFDPKFTTIPP